MNKLKITGNSVIKMGLLLFILGGSLVVLGLMGSGVALADGGPHGGYSDVSAGLPDQCAACHRVHQGDSAGKLLADKTPYALCLTCHNGAGSKLNVLDGVKLASTIAEDSSVVRSVSVGTDGANASLAPGADLSISSPGTSTFNISVRNPTSSAFTATLTLSSDSNAAAFNASVITTTTLNVAAAVGGVPSVASTTLTTSSKSGQAEGASNLTTIQVTINSQSANLVAQTRIGASSVTTLNGGGFMYTGGSPSTSRHNADPADSSLYPWGYNSNTGLSTNALSSPLQCTSCHNPHGTANYRLLKEKINGQTVVVRAYYGGSFVKDEGARGLETGAPTYKYATDYYGSASDGTGAPTTAGQGSIASLCGACHTAYPSAGAGIAYTSAGYTHYRHRTEMPYTNWLNPETGATVTYNPKLSPLPGFPNLRLASNSTQTNTIVTCLTCHRVHGTAATMSGYALKTSLGGSGAENLTPAQTSTSKSVLLYTNNRGMCQACHQW